MNNALAKLQQLYRDYISDAQTVRIQAPFAAGLVSPHKDPKLHPCHEAFYEAAGALVAQFAAQKDENPEQMLRWILEAPELHRDQEAYWYLIAAQNHAKLLIPLLRDDSRHRMGIWFSQLVPKRLRYPIQEEIAALLLK